MTYSLDDIEPRRLYSLSTFCALVPSPRRGKRTHLATARRWARRGEIVGAILRRGWWLVPGSEILRYAGVDQDAPKVRSARRRQADAKNSYARLNRIGIRTTGVTQ
jgi:hypothetical protein